MAKIFLAYESERRRAAKHLATVLSFYGFSDWFDDQLVRAGDFGSEIDRKIREANAVVVLWCSLSVLSRWIIAEAGLARQLGILIFQLRSKLASFRGAFGSRAALICLRGMARPAAISLIPYSMLWPTGSASLFTPMSMAHGSTRRNGAG
jgi:hypothetical protein